jgi:hypothetical protein
MGHAATTVREALESAHQQPSSADDTSQNATVALEMPQEENHNLYVAVRHRPRRGGRHAACADGFRRED